MSTEMAVQLNRSYIRLPKSALLNGLSFGIQQVIGEIYSFTGEAKGGKPLSCFRTYSKFMERTHLSYATVARGLRAGRSRGAIKGNNKEGFTCTIVAENGDFLRLPAWVCAEEFQVRKNKARKLKNSERKLYAVFYTRCTANKNSKHKYEASIADLANESGLSERTVQRAVWVLIRAGLIYRPKEDVGVNAYKSSTYTLNYKLVLAKEKTDREIKKEAKKALERPVEEPFPKLSETIQEGKEEFVQHAEPQPKRAKKHKTSNTYETQRKIDIPEMTLYRVGGLNFDLSKATNEELLCLRRLYVPQWVYLSVISQHFVSCIGLELKKREEQEEIQQKNTQIK